ncbi:MAG: alkaline phosphatase family protein [Streptosporangiales bacterium]|nr:alkaline phosphatase family protein [Streptosporangiales bacterium]
MTVPAPVLPRYGETTLAELFPAILGALGVPVGGPNLRLGSADRGCLLLVDGLGRAQLRAHTDTASYLTSLREPAQLTSCAPSTTATSIVSFGTGRPPGAHGVLGFKVRVPGEARMLNHLHWSDRVDPVVWQPEPTVFGRATAAGMPAFFVGPESFRDSGLTVAATRGASYLNAETADERVDAAAAALARVDRGFAYVYWGEVDLAGHVYGTASQEWRDAVAAVDAMVLRLCERLPSGTLLWVTSDHGMVDIGAEGKIDAEATPGLVDGVLLLGGEPRFRHVYARSGAAADVLRSWHEVLAGRAWVVSRDEAVESGWFGPRVERSMLARIGDVLAVPYARWAVVAPRAEPQATALIGYHGSLTRAELDVPLLEGRA